MDVIKTKNSHQKINQYGRSPKNVTFEFVKPKQKKLTIDTDTPPNNIFQNNQQDSSIVCGSCERLSFKNMLLKEKT